MTKTTNYGGKQVDVLVRDWISGGRVPYKKTYKLKPGESWFEAEETEKQWESYVLLSDGVQVPAGAVIARELKAAGAIEAGFLELWGSGHVIVNENLVCVTHSGAIGDFLEEVKALNNGKLGGFPDAIGLFGDGTIALREAKNLKNKDSLQPNQHELAALLFKAYPGNIDLKVVAWDPGV